MCWIDSVLDSITNLDIINASPQSNFATVNLWLDESEDATVVLRFYRTSRQNHKCIWYVTKHRLRSNPIITYCTWHNGWRNSKNLIALKHKLEDWIAEQHFHHSQIQLYPLCGCRDL